MTSQNLLKNLGLVLVLAGLLVLPLSSFALFKYTSSANENVLSVVDDRVNEVETEDENKPSNTGVFLEVPNNFVITKYPSK